MMCIMPYKMHTAHTLVKAPFDNLFLLLIYLVIEWLASLSPMAAWCCEGFATVSGDLLHALLSVEAYAVLAMLLYLLAPH